MLVTAAELLTVSRANRDRAVELAAKYRLPAMFSLTETVETGGLISYSADPLDGYRRVGIYVGRILKGENPGDLPIMRPTKFTLAINIKTAKGCREAPNPLDARAPTTNRNIPGSRLRRNARARADSHTAEPLDAMGRAAEWQLRRCIYRWSAAVPQPNDLIRSLVALDQNSTIIAVVELSHSSWLVWRRRSGC
jgi:hypothetical protein